MIFKNVELLGADFKFRTETVYVENGIFTETSAGEEIDCRGLKMLPGLVDIHTHGASGCDNLDTSAEAQKTIAEFMGKNGTTTFLPTLMTQSKEHLSAAAKNVAKAKESYTGGAKIGGIYMEGPYFSVKYKGAQNEAYIRDPSIDEFNEINADGLIRVVSLAPERDGAIDFIKEITPSVKVALGHTDADYDTAKEAIEAGASVLTHTYNAMRGLHHRNPNAIGAAVDSDIFCELISDGMHVHPAMVRNLYKLVGRERLVLVSDSLRPMGMPDGEYDMGGQITYVKDGKALLADGTICGSTTPLFGCMKKAVEFGIPLEDAVRAASLNPAKAAGIDGICGSIAVGRAADFLLVDNDLNLKSVYINGKEVK
ncbi:MAG: N-acetylglucosamine-6-phosphate deacetylase [Clostridia bacterium]|nr:N-acetylglucosamine-6-phosphate deacetylase [Clostridia bacterium]